MLFNTTSMAGTGAAIVVIETIAKLLGWEFPEGSIVSGVNGVVAAVGFVLLIWGQLRRSDLYLGFFRKEE